MWEFIFFVSAFIAAVTVFISLIPDGIPNPKLRAFMPLVCGIVLVSLVLIVNPQQNLETPRGLYDLKMFSPILLLPFFILAPLPFLEKKTGRVFSKRAIFFGAWITTIYYFIVSKAGADFFIQYWQAEGLIWTIFSGILSALVFFGIYLIQPFFVPFFKEKKADPSVEIHPESILIRILRIVVVIALGVSLVLSPFFLDTLMAESCGGFPVYRVDPYPAPNVTIIHLTDEKFREYPKLESLIKNSHYDPANEKIQFTRDGANFTYIGWVHFTCEEESEMDRYRSLCDASQFYEYEGKWYMIDMMQIN